MAFSYQRHIFGYECDIYGHLNNATYLQILEEARSMALAKINFSIKKLMKQKIAIFVIDIHIKYLRQIDFAENIVVKSYIKNPARVRSIWYQEIYNENGQLCATAEIVGAFAQDGKATRLSKTLHQEMLTNLEKEGIIDYPKEKA